MQFVTNLIGWNVLTQIVLILAYFSCRWSVLAFGLLYYFVPVYFCFVVVAFLAIVGVFWTVLSRVLGIRKLGVQAQRASMPQGR